MLAPTGKEIKEALAHKIMGYDAWVWDPINKIEHAMQLVPKMREKGWLFSMNTVRGDPDYIVEFRYPQEYRAIYANGADENPARAISLAAYEALCR